MSRILLATSSHDLHERVQDATTEAVLAPAPDPRTTDPNELLVHVNGAGMPDVAVLDAASVGTEHALELASRIGQQHPQISVVLVSNQAAEIGLAAMRAGVRDILHPHADPAEFTQVLARACQAAQTSPHRQQAPQTAAPSSAPTPTGRVISVVSPKGGVGKTTVASNLAVGLAKAEPHSTVLVDLDVQFGDVASALSLDPEYTLVEAVHGPASRDAMVLKTYLTQHETGLYVVCGPKSPVEADAVTADDVIRLLQMLASDFQYVVVDTAPGLSEHTLAVLDKTSELVLLSSMDVPGVRGLRKELDTLTALDMVPGARHIVLNLADKHGGISRADVEATIGTQVDLLLPRSRAAADSVNQGVPLLQSETKDSMTKHLHALVGLFSEVAAKSADLRLLERKGVHRSLGRGKK